MDDRPPSPAARGGAALGDAGQQPRQGERRQAQRRSGDRRAGDRRGGGRTPDIEAAASAATLSAPRLTALPIWPFRVVALLGAIAGSWTEYTHTSWKLWTVTVAVVLYNLASVLRPIPRTATRATWIRIVAEYALHSVVVLATGAWGSPFALCLIPTCMLAGLALGPVFAASVTFTAVAAISATHLVHHSDRDGLRESLLWFGGFGVLVFTTGVAFLERRAAAHQQRIAMARLDGLEEANSLLVSLQRVARTLPESLDLEDVVAATAEQIEALIPSDWLTVYLVNEATHDLDAVRRTGAGIPQRLAMARLPAFARRAFEAGHTIAADHGGSESSGLSGEAVAGLYAPLRARGRTIGLVALEAVDRRTFSTRHPQILDRTLEPFGVAIDNARLFRNIRVMSADAERGRLARDLHDRVGSALAYLGFEIDRAQKVAAEGGDFAPLLAELRAHLTTVLREVRETLYDLRTDVTDSQDLPTTLRQLLDRVAVRSAPLRTELRVAPTVARLPLPQERELWKIALEAITNVEKHAMASTLTVSYAVTGDRATLTIADDGIGLNKSDPPADRYGMLGIAERAEGIGATLRVMSPPDGGTVVSVDVPVLVTGTR